MLRADEALHADDRGYAEKRRRRRVALVEKRRREQGKPARPQRTKKTPPADDA